MYTAIPFAFRKPDGIRKETDTKESIRSFLDLLVSSPHGSCAADPEFGFIFKNFRFENFNEDKGILYSSNPEKETSVYHKHKIHGRSVNVNTFAFDLKKSIEQYEPRLKQVKVNMEYRMHEKTVVLTIQGKIGEKITEDFNHQIKIHVW